jgi:hypothetical protein
MRKGPQNRIVGLPLWRTAFALVGPGSRGRQTLTTFGVLLLGGVAFVFGRSIGLQTTGAQTPNQPRQLAPGVTTGLYEPSMEGRVVAYINDNEPIYRTELAEYLIARFGMQRLEFFVNRIIIERACKAKNVFITDAQIEAQFREDLKGIGQGITAELFEKEILSRYHKTVFEWKEDVIRPKLMLGALCRPMIVLTEADLKEGFEARYGPRVQCRMILCRDKTEAMSKWLKIDNSANKELAFLEEASHQGDSRMASVKGEIPPIHQHFGDKRVEHEAFNLQPHGISQVLEMNDHTAIILLCERQIPADTFKNFQSERIAIETDMREIRLAEKMNEYLKELRAAARPRMLLSHRQNIEQAEWNAQDALRQTDPQYRPVQK